MSRTVGLICQGELGARIKQQEQKKTVDKAGWQVGKLVITTAATRVNRSLASSGTAYAIDPLFEGRTCTRPS